MDERYDLVRCVTDGRYVYIRNFRPDLIYGQHLEYMWQTPTTRVWEKLYKEWKLNDEQSAFWQTKPYDELYDLTNDPDEVHNLAGLPKHKKVCEQLHKVLADKLTEIRDVGLLPEGDMHRRSAGASPYDMARDDDKYPIARVFAT